MAIFEWLIGWLFLQSAEEIAEWGFGSYSKKQLKIKGTK